MDISNLEPYKCPNFDDNIFNKKPKTFKINNKSLYAYVTFMYGTDKYLPGALCLAYSLRKQKDIYAYCVTLKK